MYSFRGEKKQRLWRYFSRRFVVLAAVLIVGGIVAAVMLGDLVYATKISQIKSPASLIDTAYAKHVASESDVIHLETVGKNLLAKKMYREAAFNLGRASDLDNENRDVAYGWAYALLQADKDGNISSIDSKAIHAGIDRAEHVDPTYLPMLKLKIIVATMENNHDAVVASQSRLDLLTKP